MNTTIARMVWINGGYTIWLGCGCKFRSKDASRDGHFIGRSFLCTRSECRKGAQ